MKKILGISAFYHDSAAAIIVGGKIVAAAQEERFTRIKHTEVFPEQAIQYCLKASNLTIDELDAVVFYEKPLLKFERLLETYYAFAPKGIISFLTAIPVWLGDKLFIKKKIRSGLAAVEKYDSKKLQLLFSEHHLSHAASSFYSSPFKDAAILTIDGAGEWNTASIYVGDGKRIQKLKKMDFPHSVGLLYSAFTYFLGFKVNSGEYKLMGLAPYGDPDSEETKKYVSLIRNHLVNIKPDGSIWLDLSYFRYTTGLRMIQTKKWESLFELKKRTDDSPINSSHCNLAWAIQALTEEIVLKMAQEVKRLTGKDSICLSGGVALNCVSNGKLRESKLFENIFIQPASGDAGGALGAALAAYHMHFDQDRVVGHAEMGDACFGPKYPENNIQDLHQQYRAVSTAFDSFANLCDVVAQKLASGKVVGWFQDRMEFGPRALGNRSILADPRSAEMQTKLNLKIKFREGFRPFAPSVLEEDCALYFDLEEPSPYMLFTAPVNKSLRHVASPVNSSNHNPLTQIGEKRSIIPAVTHMDYSARVQTVNKERNPKFHTLLSHFKQQTGCSLLINTSFNVRGEPIVCTPDDAFSCFMRTNMDCLVIGNHFLEKENQPSKLDQIFSSINFEKD